MSDAPDEKLGKLYEQLMDIRQQMLELLTAAEPEPVKDYELQTVDGTSMLSSYFGDKDTLFVIHNMGTSCAYCTVWADGLNGVLGHLEDRAGVVLTSPNQPLEQTTFAGSRGWQFKLASTADSTMAKDLGYQLDNGDCLPGVSVLQKQDAGRLVRVSHAPFGPGDSYSPVFNLFDLIPGGPGDWQPKFSYRQALS